MNSGRSNRRFYYAGDYKRSRVKRVGTKCVLDSAHPVHATMKSSFKVVEVATCQEKHLICIGHCHKGMLMHLCRMKDFIELNQIEVWTVARN